MFAYISKKAPLSVSYSNTAYSRPSTPHELPPSVPAPSPWLSVPGVFNLGPLLLLTSPVQSLVQISSLLSTLWSTAATPLYTTKPQSWPSEVPILPRCPPNSPFWTLNLIVHFSSSLAKTVESLIPTSEFLPNRTPERLLLLCFLGLDILRLHACLPPRPSSSTGFKWASFFNQKVHGPQLSTWFQRPPLMTGAPVVTIGLSNITIPDRYPVPHLQEFTSALYGKSMFSKIDLVRAFHKIPIAPEDIPKWPLPHPMACLSSSVCLSDSDMPPKLSRVS
uniref:Reverse transcriptase domain-containing protein n=1 Tax=Schistocephalus solidus TaxID=70667 RepID=A0A0X3NRU4_SCHSO